MKRIDIVNELCAAVEQDRRSTFNIAQAAGVSEKTIYYWLKGRTSNPRVDMLDKVARVLGLQVAFVDGHYRLAPVAAHAIAATAAKRPRMALWRLQ